MDSWGPAVNHFQNFFELHYNFGNTLVVEFFIS